MTHSSSRHNAAADRDCPEQSERFYVLIDGWRRGFAGIGGPFSTVRMVPLARLSHNGIQPDRAVMHYTLDQAARVKSRLAEEQVFIQIVPVDEVDEWQRQMW